MTASAPSRVTVNLESYAHNLHVVQGYLPPDCSILAVLKANAYGHGMVPIATEALKQGVAMVGVATVPEGAELRESGFEGPILVMVQPARDALSLAIEHDLRLMVSDITLAEQIGELARRANKIVSVHCKIDTGMGRQGFDPEKAPQDLVFLTHISNLDIEGIATHFPNAAVKGDPFTAQQIRSFKQLLKQFGREGIPYEMSHAANSAGLINFPESHFDMVRVGLMTYGLWPTDAAPDVTHLRPVLRWESQVVLLKSLPSRHSIGYERTFKTKFDSKMAVVPVGYADGYPHTLSNCGEVLIQGKRCPVRGAVSMDEIVVDVTHLSEVASGDTVTLIGSDGDEEIKVTELAKRAGMISYDILAGLGRRSPRVYVP